MCELRVSFDPQQPICLSAAVCYSQKKNNDTFWSTYISQVCNWSVILTERPSCTDYQYALVLSGWMHATWILLLLPSPAHIELTGHSASGSKHFYILCWLPVTSVKIAYLFVIPLHRIISTLYKKSQKPPKYQNIPTHSNVETINPEQYSRVNIEYEHMYWVYGGKLVSVKIPHQQPKRKSVIRKYKAGCLKHGFNWISVHPCPCPQGKMLCNHKIGAGS